MCGVGRLGRLPPPRSSAARLVGHPRLDLVRLEQGKAIDHLQLVQTLKTALERQQAAAATRSAPMGGAVETQADRHVRYRAARYSR